MICEDSYQGPWVQAKQVVHELGNKINESILRLNSTHRTQVPSVFLTNGETKTFQEDIQILNNNLSKEGLYRGDSANFQGSRVNLM